MYMFAIFIPGQIPFIQGMLDCVSCLFLPKVKDLLNTDWAHGSLKQMEGKHCAKIILQPIRMDLLLTKRSRDQLWKWFTCEKGKLVGRKEFKSLNETPNSTWFSLV
ncbi:hypothetical protein AVEN_197835-1 [Araneus ventricosus]|uniref:Uncharacterized protein n=1 Tax=Araneus ventricosus TaxID=182803 RepID=A0A4Y2R1J4_ARAVE|nr:hypothetical protein AVEN_197835-1 [Araneus ventricosus]